jgi:hypothetical protein
LRRVHRNGPINPLTMRLGSASMRCGGTLRMNVAASPRDCERSSDCRSTWDAAAVPFFPSWVDRRFAQKPRRSGRVSWRPYSRAAPSKQGNGPAADGASFSLNSNLLECGRSRFFLPVPRQFGAWGIVPPAFITASVNCVRAEGLSRLTSSLRETRLRGWPYETRTQT